MRPSKQPPQVIQSHNTKKGRLMQAYCMLLEYMPIQASRYVDDDLCTAFAVVSCLVIRGQRYPNPGIANHGTPVDTAQMPLVATRVCTFKDVDNDKAHLAILCADHSSVNLSSKCMLNIITSNPIVTTISSAKPNQPSTIAEVPTPLLTLPLPKSCAICAAATEAVCCHSTLTSTKIEAMKISASAT